MFCFPNAGLVRELLIQVSSYSSAYLGLIYEKTKGQIPRDFHWKNRTYMLKRSILIKLLGIV